MKSQNNERHQATELGSAANPKQLNTKENTDTLLKTKDKEF